MADETTVGKETQKIEDKFHSGLDEQAVGLLLTDVQSGRLSVQDRDKVLQQITKDKPEASFRGKIESIELADDGRVQLTKAMVGGGTIIERVGNKDSQLMQVTYPNGVTRKLTYFADGTYDRSSDSGVRTLEYTHNNSVPVMSYRYERNNPQAPFILNGLDDPLIITMITPLTDSGNIYCDHKDGSSICFEPQGTHWTKTADSKTNAQLYFDNNERLHHVYSELRSGFGDKRLAIHVDRDEKGSPQSIKIEGASANVLKKEGSDWHDQAGNKITAPEVSGADGTIRWTQGDRSYLQKSDGALVLSQKTVDGRSDVVKVAFNDGSVSEYKYFQDHRVKEVHHFGGKEEYRYQRDKSDDDLFYERESATVAHDIQINDINVKEDGTRVDSITQNKPESTISYYTDLTSLDENTAGSRVKCDHGLLDEVIFHDKDNPSGPNGSIKITRDRDDANVVRRVSINGIYDNEMGTTSNIELSSGKDGQWQATENGTTTKITAPELEDFGFISWKRLDNSQGNYISSDGTIGRNIKKEDAATGVKLVLNEHNTVDAVDFGPNGKYRDAGVIREDVTDLPEKIFVNGGLIWFKKENGGWIKSVGNEEANRQITKVTDVAVAKNGEISWKESGLMHKINLQGNEEQLNANSPVVTPKPTLRFVQPEQTIATPTPRPFKPADPISTPAPSTPAKPDATPTRNDRPKSIPNPQQKLDDFDRLFRKP